MDQGPQRGGAPPFARRRRAVVAQQIGEHDEGIRQRIGDAIADGQLPSLRRLADLAVRDDELVELLASQAGRRAWEFVVGLYMRMGVREVPTSVWQGFQRKALGLVSAYFAILFQVTLATKCLAPLVLGSGQWALPLWILPVSGCCLQATIEIVRLLQHRYPLGHIALLGHAVLHGLVWGFMSQAFAGRLLLELVAVFGIAWLAAFVNASSAALSSDPKQCCHLNAWLAGWATGLWLIFGFAAWFGSSRSGVLVVGLESLAAAMGAYWQTTGLFQQCKLDDSAMVTVAAVRSLLATAHGQLLFLGLWCVASSFLESVMTVKVAYYIGINCAGAALLSRCLWQCRKDPWAHGGAEAAEVQ